MTRVQFTAKLPFTWTTPMSPSECKHRKGAGSGFPKQRPPIWVKSEFGDLGALLQHSDDVRPQRRCPHPSCFPLHPYRAQARVLYVNWRLNGRRALRNCAYVGGGHFFFRL